MSVGLTIQSDDLAELVTAVETLGGGITGNELLRLVGFSMEETIREHLEMLSRDPAHHQTARSLGAAPTGFYERAAEAVQSPQLESDGVSISIDHEGLAQRYFGGSIAARAGGYLTIPARAEAYGHRAREFKDLQFLLFPSGLAALVQKGEPAHEGSVYYWLVRSVYQSQDETVLPTEEEIFDPAMERVQAYITRIWDEGARPA
jgi:hypothetical protein